MDLSRNNSQHRKLAAPVKVHTNYECKPLLTSDSTKSYREASLTSSITTMASLETLKSNEVYEMMGPGMQFKVAPLPAHDRSKAVTYQEVIRITS